MPEIKDVLERESRSVDLEPGDFERLLGRREQTERNRRIRAGVVAVLVIVVVVGTLIQPFSSGVVPPLDSDPTQNGEPADLRSYTSPDREVSLSVPRGWETMLWGGPATEEAAGDGGLTVPRDVVLPDDVWFGVVWPGPVIGDQVESIGLVDPVAYDAWCAANGGSPLLPAPADAAAIVRQVMANPNFETTPPVAARVGGVEAVSIDAELAPGGEACRVYMVHIARWIHSLVKGEGLRLRLYLVDLPEGMSVRTLAITVVAPKERFEEFIEATGPIIESIEFHPG